MDPISFAIATAAFMVSVVAMLLTLWQVIRGEQDFAGRAWSMYHLAFRDVAPGRVGVEVELSIVGRAVLFSVEPFTQGGMTLHEMSGPRKRIDCTSDPIRFVADFSVGPDHDDDAWVGVMWLTSTRWGRVHIEQALRVHLRTARIEHWLWPRGPVPLTWRRDPRGGRWGTRPVRLGRARYDVPGLDESILRERAREDRSRKWPPRRRSGS